MPRRDETGSPLPYRADADAAGDYVEASRRTLKGWIILLFVWTLGAAVMVGYVLLLAILVHRWFSNPTP